MVPSARHSTDHPGPWRGSRNGHRLYERVCRKGSRNTVCEWFVSSSRIWRRVATRENVARRIANQCLRETWHRVIDSVKSETLFIGGKSMGGRIASLVADEAEVAGLICLGYPFHPTGKPEQLRIEHLKSIRTPTLIVQGERDPFGNRQEVSGYKLSKHVRVHWLPDGDHSFKPRKASGRTLEENWAEGIDAVASFVSECREGRRE